MTFISASFAILFTCVLAARLTVGRNKTGWPYYLILTVASVVFYAWHAPQYLWLLMATAGTDYIAGVFLSRAGSKTARAWALGLALAINLGVLLFFKYMPVYVTGLYLGMSALGLTAIERGLVLTQPIGLSFYTFHSMSYSVDIYRNSQKPLRSFPKFFLFVSFFPQMVAGPIVRAREFLPQITRPRRLRLPVMQYGAYLFIRGLFLKTVCADNLAKLVDAHWVDGYAAAANGSVIWITALMFAIQIYCDFEGYCSIARGAAYLLGFRLPLNFDHPYIATSFRDFWTRWHITLSRWLRDYLYFPLGGNRGSISLTLRNLIVVMIIGGAWHGRNPTFVLWGAWHGLCLAIERGLGLHDLERREGHLLAKKLWPIVVQLGVLVGWVFFRSDSPRGSLVFITGLFSAPLGMVPRDLGMGLLFVLPPLAAHLRAKLVESKKAPALFASERAFWAALMLVATLMGYARNQTFIYFQF